MGDGVGLGAGATVTGGGDGSCVGEPPHDISMRQPDNDTANLVVSIENYLKGSTLNSVQRARGYNFRSARIVHAVIVLCLPLPRWPEPYQSQL